MVDVVGFIEDTITFSDTSTVPVFRLKDLTDMYKKQMVLYGTSAKEPERGRSLRASREKF